MAELIRREKDNFIYYTAPQLDAYRQISHAFFTRAGGVSEGKYSSLNFRFASEDKYENVIENHLLAGALLGAEPQNIVCTNQKHTDNIRVFKESVQDFDPNEPVDALITDIKGLCLTAYFADCQPIMFYDRKKQVCAIVHAGWRGVANAIAIKTLDKMHEVWGCEGSDIIAAMGPAICRVCFETDEDVPGQLMETYDNYVSEYIFKNGDKWHVDLKNITYRALVSWGLSPINVSISSLCPSCTSEPELWWSHRRNGEDRGVQGAMIMLR